MANFNNLALTVNGIKALLAAQAGTTLTLSKIGMGSGSATNSVILTDLVTPELMMPISEKTVNEDSNYVTISARMTNENITEGFYWRETGLFFEDSEGKDVLFAYASVSNDQYDYIPAYSDQRYIKHVRIANVITDSANVTIKETEGLIYVDTLTFEKHLKNTNNPHKVTASQIGAITTEVLNAEIAKYLPLAGGTLSNSLYLSNGNVYVGNADKNDASRLMLENAKHKISFELSAAGNMGIFDHTDDKWLMQIPADESRAYVLNKAIATSADLAKYLPLAGGTLSGSAIWINNGVGRLFTDTSATYLEWYKTAKDNNNKTGIIIKNGVINMYKVVSGTTSIYEMYDTHNITASTSDLTASSSALATNAIHLTYS